MYDYGLILGPKLQKSIASIAREELGCCIGSRVPKRWAREHICVAFISEALCVRLALFRDFYSQGWRIHSHAQAFDFEYGSELNQRHYLF